jgi:biopolymer transport protein ExbD
MKKRSRIQAPSDTLGFQIAPMIDVVFVIMLFFMVMAGSVKVERELNTKLPGTAETQEPTEFLDEAIITISQAGEVMLNDEPMDTPNSKSMEQLKGTLMRAKQASDAAKSKFLVTIVSEPEARYSRTVDVLDALALAQVDNVSFTIAEEE